MIPDSLTMPLWQLYGLYVIYIAAVVGIAILLWQRFSWKSRVKRMKRDLAAEYQSNMSVQRIKAIAEAHAQLQGRMGRPTLVVVQFDKPGQRGDAA